MSEAVDCDYSIQGSGPALFLTHGIGAAKNAWRFLLPELSKHFTVVTYDLRGHGNSPVTNKNFTLDDLVSDLEKIRERTKIDAIGLVWCARSIRHLKAYLAGATMHWWALPYRRSCRQRIKCHIN